MNVVDLPVEKIRPKANNPRKYFDPKADDELAQSIAERGLIHPVVVARIGDGYELCAGERRFRAHLKLGKKTIRTTVLDDVSEAERDAITLDENLHDRDISPLELATAYRDYMKRHNINQKQLAAKVSKSSGDVSDILSLLKVQAGTQELALQGKVPFSHLRLLSRLRDANLQVRLAKEVADSIDEKGKPKITVLVLKDRIEQLKNGNSAQATKGQRAHWSMKIDLVRKSIEKACNTLDAVRPPPDRQTGVKSAVRFLRLAAEQLTQKHKEIQQ